MKKYMIIQHKSQGKLRWNLKYKKYILEDRPSMMIYSEDDISYFSKDGSMWFKENTELSNTKKMHKYWNKIMMSISIKLPFKKRGYNEIN